MRKKNRQRFWLDANSFLAVLFSFFFVFAQASDSANTGIQNCETEDNSTSGADAHFIVDHNQPFHFPLSSFPIPAEQEVKDGLETSDHTDDAPDKVFTSLSLKERFNLSSHKCLLLQLLNSRENRKEVSLFILHHSWKTFLS
jgi:hypothetical protein